jgi:hypothetical protein
MDLEKPHTTGTIAGLRISNAAGDYYVRGALLDTSNGRILFRSSRGGLKSWPGTLQAQ